MAAKRPVENVWNYPRPPALQPTSARLRVVWRRPGAGPVVVAETTRGYRVLETSHPPTYYFPPSDVDTSLLKRSQTARRTFCEWKGEAGYWDLFLPKPSASSSSTTAAAPPPLDDRPASAGRIWSYASPTPAFAPIRDYFCFYVDARPRDRASLGEWECYVDDDRATAQEGDFYGSWVTPEITGGDRGFKGGAGTWGW